MVVLVVSLLPLEFSVENVKMLRSMTELSVCFNVIQSVKSGDDAKVHSSGTIYEDSHLTVNEKIENDFAFCLDERVDISLKIAVQGHLFNGEIGLT